jgi:chromosomal replication initiation ATPase DnaA
MTAPTKLRSVLEEAKQHLAEHVAEKKNEQAKASDTVPSSEQVKARSKLNTLRGVKTVQQRPLSVFQRVGVPQRPTYDLIADRVLGSDVGEHRTFLDESSAYGDHVAKRLRHLHERLNAVGQEPTHGAPSTYVGVEDDGRPVWSQVLDEQRGRASYPLAKAEVTSSLEKPLVGRPVSISDWPTRMTWSSSRTFKQWFVGEENFEATRLCEAVVDQPAARFNPLYLHAAPQSGCSLLLHATGQAWLRRSEGHVLLLSAADLHEVDPMDASWSEALPGATGIIVDDVHLFGAHDAWRHQLGVLLDHALNLGLHVLVGGRDSVQALPASRLKEVLNGATSVAMAAPSVATLLGFARWRCGQKNLLMSDVHLAQMARMNPTGWAGVESRLEQVSLSIEQGAVLLDHDDVSDLLIGAPRSEPSPLEHQRVEDLAAAMVGDVLDSVYSNVEPGGIDLHAPLEAWGEDDYTVPEWDEDALASRGTLEFDRRLKETIDAVTPGKPSVLDVHERERFLVSNREPLKVSDLERAVDVLVDLDAQIDQRMDVSERMAQTSTTELAQLEDAMVLLAQRAVEADIDELITIADELRAIEERLVELDPERAPLPPFEAETSTKGRRTVGRRRPAVTSVPDEPGVGSSLDEYEPDGEWNIDGTGIEADDLLDDSAEPQRVRLARLHPKTVLVGEEE